MNDPTISSWSRENDLLFQLRRLREENERLREDKQSVDAVDTLTEEGWIWDGDQWQRPADQEPVLQDIEQYRLQMAGISTAAIGYWKEGDGIHPDYDTLALRDVAKLYAKYNELYKAQPVSQAVIAGALFDFMAWLTTRDERLVLSGADEAGPAVDAIRDFAKMRSLSLDDAQVQDWQDFTTPSCPQRKPMTNDEIVDEYYKFKAAQPAPAQEPVACIQDLDEVKRKHLVYEKGMDWKDPLYTTPPAAQQQWVGLTDEEIRKLAKENIFVLNAIIATNAKLKEKNT